MARPSRLILALAGLTALVVIVLVIRNNRTPADLQPSTARGGAIVSSIRGEPRTFNRLVARDATSETISQLIHGRLVRVNRATQDLEPWLAEKWTASADNLTYTLTLRPGLRFSDGVPCTSADVVFTFRAIYDERTNSTLADSVRVGGKRLEVQAVDSSTLTVRFPSPFGPGIRLLDNVPILPRHKLEAALEAGTLASAWRPDTPVADVVGLGSFKLAEYQPGHRLVFERNPHYWRTGSGGEPLPYADRVTLEIVPDQNAELLRLQAGQIDFTQSEIRAEDYAALKAAERDGKVRLVDLGAGLDADSLWFNLRPGPRIPESKKRWLHAAAFRQAISHAVDRQAFANTVFLGAAEPIHGPVTAGNKTWYCPDLPQRAFDQAKARELLASAGLTDADDDGMLEDATGDPASFTLLTQKGNTALEQGAALIRDSLEKVGVRVAVVPLEVGALIERIERADYDAIYFRFLWTDLDPALHLDFWLSSGGAHVWNPSQAVPATEWEKEIDQLMLQQAATVDQAERKRLFDQAQRLLAEHLPIIYFVAPRVIVATSNRIANVSPALLRPIVLWNADTLAVAVGGKNE